MKALSLLSFFVSAPVWSAELGTDGGVEGHGFDLKEHVSLRESWMAPAALGLERWQWLALLVLGVVVGLLTLLLGRLTARLVRRLSREKGSAGRLIERLAGPLKLGWAALLGRAALPVLMLTGAAEAGAQLLLRVGLGVALFWGALRALETWSARLVASDAAQARRALVKLFSKVGHLSLLGLAVLWTLSELGYSVSHVLAGLGIGGIALALGAQKTLENLFGAFALALDEPFREGDLVRVDEMMGTVESIGLRSTRIRTLDRTVVSIPNGKLADGRIETFAARDRVRLHTTVGLSHGTTTAQLEQVLEGFREALRAEEKLWPEGASVHLVKIGETSQELEVSAWFQSTQPEEFNRIRERMLLRFLLVVEGAGTSVASCLHAVQWAKGSKANRGS